MADVLPKVKLYLFLTLLLVLINIGIFISRQTVDINIMLASIGTSFIPFSGLISLATNPGNMPIEFIAFAGIVEGIFSGIITYLLAEIILSHIPLLNT